MKARFFPYGSGYLTVENYPKPDQTVQCQFHSFVFAFQILNRKGALIKNIAYTPESINGCSPYLSWDFKREL